MKLNFIFVVIAIIVVFIVGFKLGFGYQSTKNSGSLNILPLSCNYNGNTYKDGEGFKSSDGCNSCSCQNGQIACTEMACLPD